MLLEDKTIVSNIKKTCWNSFIAAFLLIVFAVVLLINPENFVNIAINVFGYIAVLMGVLNVVFYFRIPKEQRVFSKNFTTGLLLFIFGIISFIKTDILKDIITLLIGGYLIFRNVDRANIAMNIRQYKEKMWIYLLVISFISIILSFFIVMNPFSSLLTENAIIAIMIIISESLLIIQNIMILVGLRSNEKQNKEE